VSVVVDCDPVRKLELARTRALLADGLDETTGALEHLLAVVVGVGHDG
jgi:hypothetical protein